MSANQPNVNWMAVVKAQMNCSKHLDNTGMSDIGHRFLRMSFGGCILGRGLTLAHFHSCGRVPSPRLLLKIAHTSKYGGIVT